MSLLSQKTETESAYYNLHEFWNCESLIGKQMELESKCSHPFKPSVLSTKP